MNPSHDTPSGPAAAASGGYFTSERSIRQEPTASGSTSQSSEVTPSWAQYSPVLLQPSKSAPWV